MIKSNNGSVEYKGLSSVIVTDYVLITKSLIEEGILNKEIFKWVWETATMTEDELRNSAEKLPPEYHMMSLITSMISDFGEEKTASMLRDLIERGRK